MAPSGGSAGVGAAGTATFRFYAELNDFLPPARRATTFERPIDPGGTVKDAVEAIGVPHTEVDLVVVNGESVAFEHRLRDGDRVAVYPVFEAFDITPVVRLRPAPLRDPRFVLDGHLGTLARHLRLLGFDTAYRNDIGDDELVACSLREHRILLTRDRGVLKRRVVTHGSYVHATDPRRQVVEVVRRFHLEDALHPFTRCLACNGALRTVDEENVVDRLPAGIRGRGLALRTCEDCGRVYWRGTHHARLAALVVEVTQELDDD